MLLRLAVGWHFFREGADKLIEGDFTSVGFFQHAKGPFVPIFKWFIWDGEGRARLDKERTLEAWNHYRQQVVDHFGFDEKQQKRADGVLAYRTGQLEAFFEEHAEDLAKYARRLERRAAQRSDPAYREVAGLRGQAEKTEAESDRDLTGWLATIDAIWKGYEQDLNGLVTEDQAGRGWLALGKPGRHLLDTVFIDLIIPYFDLIVGACLILGLATRLSALAGAGFLASIVATQFPGAEGAAPTYYQIIEMLSMLVLAAFGAGRFAGLDFFVNLLRLRCWPPKTEKNT